MGITEEMVKEYSVQEDIDEDETYLKIAALFEKHYQEYLERHQ